ncbi:uncharacterized protein [Vulpes vulpes]|uniref:Uncharacterized protein n=1 Tax=Vulpes vulpes TaxID=9627 RepID=A0ABM5AVK9_VULVU
MTLADVASVGAGRCAAGHLPAPPDPGVCALRLGPQRASPQLQQNTLSSPRNGARFLQGDVGSERAWKGKVTPAPISAPGDVHLREGKRKGGPSGGGFFGSSRLPALGRGGAPVGKEVERERVRAGIAEDLPSEPKDVLSPGLTPLLASSARVCATPLAAGLTPQSAPGRNRSPSSASSRPLRSTPSTSLPPSGPHSRASTGGVFFLGPHACACTRARERSGPRPTHLRALLPAPGSRPAGLSQPSRLRPGWPPGALLSGVAYKGRLLWPRARKASVARFFPHPHEILGLTPPCRRPWASGRVGQRPTTRAEVPLNAPGEWARGELDRYLNEDLRAACWAQSASSRALLLAREGARRRQNAAEARSCSWHPRLSQAVVLKEQ